MTEVGTERPAKCGVGLSPIHADAPDPLIPGRTRCTKCRLLRPVGKQTPGSKAVRRVLKAERRTELEENARPLRHNSDPPASHAAAERAVRSSAREALRLDILDALRTVGPLTVDELAEHLGHPHRFDVARRVTDLKRDGVVRYAQMRGNSHVVRLFSSGS